MNKKMIICGIEKVEWCKNEIKIKIINGIEIPHIPFIHEGLESWIKRIVFTNDFFCFIPKWNTWNCVMKFFMIIGVINRIPWNDIFQMILFQKM